MRRVHKTSLVVHTSTEKSLMDVISNSHLLMLYLYCCMHYVCMGSKGYMSELKQCLVYAYVGRDNMPFECFTI